MPQGKGTYGSKVGRPPKKKYNKGGNVDPFSTRNPEGVPAEQMAEAMEDQNMASEGLPTSDARDRMQTSPDTTSYKEGGKLEDWKEEGYAKWTKTMKDEVLGNRRNIYDTDITDIVKLRSRRKKEIEKSKKGKK
jgi:hypothetical protein